MTFGLKISASKLQLIPWVEKGNMKDHQYLKERLENRMEWKNYYEGLMRMWIINDAIKEEYYRNKPFLKIFLSLYFLPLNMLKLYQKLKDKHYYGKVTTEIEVIKRALKYYDDK